MATPQQSQQERLADLRARHRRMSIPQVALESDAIDESLGVGTALQKIEATIIRERARQERVQQQQRAQNVKRTEYRTRKRAEQAGKSDISQVPAEIMSDQAIDAAIAQEERNAALRADQSQIGTTSPVWNYPAETRRALGYYTNNEREQAAQLNDIRSNTFLGSVMPNFGRQAAYNNPGAEMDAFRQTALYVPNAVMGGLSFNLPSATQAAVTGARTGWQTVGNVAQRAVKAGTKAVKSAAPVMTNPRWATTTTAFTVPLAASAANDDNSGVVVGSLGTLAALGLGAYLTKGKLWGKTPEATTEAAVSSQYAYKPKYGLFSWEHPTSWARRQKQSIKDAKMAKAIDEWNAAVGDPAKEKAFIEKYNIREAEGTPQWINKEVTKPKTYRAAKMETVQEPVMEDVTSSILGPDGKPVIVQRPKLGADGKPIMQSVEREVKDAAGNPVMQNKPVLDGEGKPVMKTFTRREPKLGDDGEQIIVYNPISRDDVRPFLQGRTGDDYTSNLFNIDDIILRGPTSRQQLWARLRNVGRIGTFSVPAGGFAAYLLSGTKSSDGSSNKGIKERREEIQDRIQEKKDSIELLNQEKVLRDVQKDLNNTKQSSSSDLPEGFVPIEGVRGDSVAVRSNSGRVDSIVDLSQPRRTGRFGREAN